MINRPRRFALRAAVAFTLLALCCLTASARPPGSINYRLMMSRPASHLFEVAIEVETTGGRADEYLDFQMPRWTPGRYSVFEFAKNVQEFHASSSCGERMCAIVPLPVTRLDDQTWRVEARGMPAVTVTYKVFADDLSGTFSQLDQTHASFNGGSLFMYVVDHKQDPVRLSISPPAGWRIVNGRTERAGQREWQFPNYDLLIDTPTEIAPNWTQDDFIVGGKTYHVVVHSLGEEGGKRPALVRDLEKIVRAETGMWGAPEFDSYTFMIHFAADDRSLDGMEHLTSTNIIEPGALADPGIYGDTLETAAHEFFHVWNVKRLRPIELGPWDFTRPAKTRGLWIAEGLTQYYGELMLRRAGLWTDKQLLKRFGDVLGGIENNPGSRLMSAEESSLVAPFLDGAPEVQRTNLFNTSVSYYYKGEILGLVLDLLIRRATRGQASLDDVMRQMYEEFYLKSPAATYYLRGRGFTGEDFERVASRVAGRDLREFFARHVRGVEVPPYDEAFATVGLRLVREPVPAKASAGFTLDDEGEDRLVKIKNIRAGSAAADAGLKQGDVILSVGNMRVTREKYMAALDAYRRGARVPLTVRRDRRTFQASIRQDAPGASTYRLEEAPQASAQARSLRAAWLSGGPS
ncbi:MAG TPA: PDZ domain-containing protein [Pyrinomonadaceae bacterium]|jgi:predicted metalloprotease with PDZ domain